jgi:hypothetical protein
MFIFVQHVLAISTRQIDHGRFAVIQVRNFRRSGLRCSWEMETGGLARLIKMLKRTRNLINFLKCLPQGPRSYEEIYFNRTFFFSTSMGVRNSNGLVHTSHCFAHLITCSALRRS